MLSAPGERVLDKELRGTRAAVGASEGEGREQTRVRKESHWEFKLECEGAGQLKNLPKLHSMLELGLGQPRVRKRLEMGFISSQLCPKRLKSTLINNVVRQPFQTSCLEQSQTSEKFMGNPGSKCLFSNHKLYLGSESQKTKM